MKYRTVFAAVLALSLSSACNSSGGGSSAPEMPSSGSPSGAPSQSTSGGTPSSSNGANSSGPNSSANTAAGESCLSSDPQKLCLAVHFVTYKDSAGTAAANAEQAATIIHTMNQLWGACNIGFQIETYEQVDPVQYGLSYGAQSQNELTSVRKTFNTRSDELLAVTTGPWGTSVNAWTAMPGSAPYGAVMEKSIVTYGNGIIYAHEFGHYLGLDHVSDTSDLMDAIIYTSSTKLTSSQCQDARDTANSYWTAMLRN